MVETNSVVGPLFSIILFIQEGLNEYLENLKIVRVKVGLGHLSHSTRA